jgi:hypothetical protein
VPCSPNPPRSNCSQRQSTFIEDMRTQLLGPKRVFDNIRKSVGAISEAIACNSDDGTCRLRVVRIITLETHNCVTHSRWAEFCCNPDGSRLLPLWLRAVGGVYRLVIQASDPEKRTVLATINDAFGAASRSLARSLTSACARCFA